jgi:hypothetical protein
VGVEPGKLVAAMERTGTYGDAIRRRLADLGVATYLAFTAGAFAGCLPIAASGRDILDAA